MKISEKKIEDVLSSRKVPTVDKKYFVNIVDYSFFSSQSWKGIIPDGHQLDARPNEADRDGQGCEQCV